MELLADVIHLLANGETLPEKNKDHALSGEYSGCRECHIIPDWLLIMRLLMRSLSFILQEQALTATCFEQYLQRNYWNPKPLGMENNAKFFERVIFDAR